jgi:hypothetical protein
MPAGVNAAIVGGFLLAAATTQHGPAFVKTKILLTLVIVAVALSRPAAQRPNAPGPVERRWTHPRTPWGDPDLEGVWTTDNNFSIPLERPVEVADNACHEGNRGLENILSAARAEERAAQAGK